VLPLGTPPTGLRACHPHIARAAGITRSVFTFSYALHLTFRLSLFTSKALALDNRHCNSTCSCALATDRSIARLNRVESLALSAMKGVPPPGVKLALQTARYPNPNFQSSIRVVFQRGRLCSKLLFHSLRATEDNKIRVLVNSISESKIARISGQESRLTYIVIFYQATRLRRSSL
jgi:hypothetical protein